MSVLEQFRDEQFININGINAIFINGHLSDEEQKTQIIESGYFIYPTRHGDDNNWADPVTVEHNVVVNFCSDIITAIPFDIPASGFIEVKTLDYLDNLEDENIDELLRTTEE